MKWRKTAAVLSLLLALSISLSACGGGTAEPSPSSESEEAPYSEETSGTTSAAELSDEQREALDDWIWYERGDYTSENWYHIASDGTVEMHTEYGSTEDTYTAYPMLGCSYNFEGFDVGPDDVPFLSLHMEENVFNSVEIIEDGRAFLIGNFQSRNQPQNMKATMKPQLLVRLSQQKIIPDQPIEGLYASGNTCGMRFGPEYITPIPGVSIGMCLTLGRELGRYLAAK